MSFYPENHLNLEELIAHFQSSPLEGEEYASIYYPEVALLIRQQGEAGIAFLWREIDRADTERLRAILFALTVPPLEHHTIGDRLLSYLHDERPSIVAEAVDSLCRLGAKDTANQVLPLLQHPSGYVRGSVLRFMSRLHPDKAYPLLIEALKDPDFIVRENAADELGELDGAEAIPYLRPLLVDSHPDVQQAAQTAIEMLEESESDKVIH
ncbi:MULTISPECIES: HEAT repeat domain-containing protein [Cyanophyceae]|uniref:HEAT repeat domain-containing protein n=1 Tax=Cyanophyceae TaxID=3028117 RepID=UPI0016893080|nr:HEAT repeat domain-containing protein [Trichocoleus sp. FACHB-69]MBD1932668.1 HEAT repeat domain-containing protein [Trichocoleus sp. FACHB-69]